MMSNIKKPPSGWICATLLTVALSTISMAACAVTKPRQQNITIPRNIFGLVLRDSYHLSDIKIVGIEQLSEVELRVFYNPGKEYSLFPYSEEEIVIEVDDPLEPGLKVSRTARRSPFYADLVLAPASADKRDAISLNLNENRFIVVEIGYLDTYGGTPALLISTEERCISFSNNLEVDPNLYVKDALGLRDTK